MKRLSRNDAIERAEKQLRAYMRSQDPEAHAAIAVAKDALVFLRGTKRKCFTSKEVDALLDW